METDCQIMECPIHHDHHDYDWMAALCAWLPNNVISNIILHICILQANEPFRVLGT